MGDIELKALIFENGKLSLGRVLSIVTFGILCYFWFAGKPAPSSLITVLLTTLGYNASKKFTSPVQSYLDSKLEIVRQTKEGSDAGKKDQG